MRLLVLSALQVLEPRAAASSQSQPYKFQAAMNKTTVLITIHSELYPRAPATLL